MQMSTYYVCVRLRKIHSSDDRIMMDRERKYFYSTRAEFFVFLEITPDHSDSDSVLLYVRR